MKILGLDEAGRGSVLGPMTIGAYCCDAVNEPLLRAAGADDSKRLSKKRRVAAREPLAALGQVRVRVVSAAEIDATNINQIEERVFAELILELEPDAVYIDAPVHPRGIPALTERLIAALAAGGRATPPALIIEPKADVTWPVVGAASIFAKTDRDAAIAALGPVGSGYPSDPKTRAWITDFLARDAPLPPCVRSRWGTIDILRSQLNDG